MIGRGARTPGALFYHLLAGVLCGYGCFFVHFRIVQANIEMVRGEALFQSSVLVAKAWGMPADAADNLGLYVIPLCIALAMLVFLLYPLRFLSTHRSIKWLFLCGFPLAILYRTQMQHRIAIQFNNVCPTVTGNPDESTADARAGAIDHERAHSRAPLRRPAIPKPEH